MRHTRPYLYTVFALLLVLASACARSSDIKGDLQRRYNEMDAAMQKKSVDDVSKFMSDDFMAHMESGQALNRSQMLGKLSDGFKEAASIDSTTTVDQAVLDGDRADATATTKQRVVYKDPFDKQHTMEITSRSRDVWHWRQGDWRLVEYSEGTHAATVDGSPLPKTSASTKPR